MINQLQKLYPSLQVIHATKEKPSTAYYWFVTNEQDIIGIAKKELAPKEYELLATFLTPYENRLPIKTIVEEQWFDRIHHDKKDAIQHPYRFIFFSMDDDHIHPQAFKEAIKELFNRDVPILWKNHTEGMMIEEHFDLQEESISYEQIINLLMSDLYVNLKFFIGPVRHDLERVKQLYHNLSKAAKISFQSSRRTVIHYTEGLLYLMMDKVDEPIKQAFIQGVLQEFAHDHEYIQSIETFLESDMNISVAAKKMYMHRNTLQYRIDKFAEKTGLDIRNFHQAVTVYLALIAND